MPNRFIFIRSRAAWALTALVVALGVLGGSMLFTQSTHAQQVEATLTVVVHGLRNDRGTIRGGLYREASRWTHDDGQIASCVGRPIHGIARCVFDAIAPGAYGLALFHDEDDDGSFDRDSIGLPQEGYGFGRDARPGLGAPSFESALVRIGLPGTETRVQIRYGI